MKTIVSLCQVVVVCGVQLTVDAEGSVVSDSTLKANFTDTWACEKLGARRCAKHKACHLCGKKCEPIAKDCGCDPTLLCGEAITCVDGQLYPTTCGPRNCDAPMRKCPSKECDPTLLCGQAFTCVDGELYPTTCGPRNCDAPVGKCPSEECDPTLLCGQAFTCVDGELYPTTCGPRNCDAPVRKCSSEDPSEECTAQNSDPSCPMARCAAPPLGCDAVVNYAKDSQGRCCPTLCEYVCPECVCGEPCEENGFRGVCQADGKTCANNILPPNCPSDECTSQNSDPSCLMPACAAPPPGCDGILVYNMTDGKCCPTGCKYECPKDDVLGVLD